jgi:multidrug resistance efflux pump
MDFKKINKKKLALIAVPVLVIGLALGAYSIIKNQEKIYVDKAVISAPTIDLSSAVGGALSEILVKEGDRVLENQVVARVGNELIKARNDGLVIKADDNIGKNFQRGESIVSMIEPRALRVVAHLDEDKGLKDVKIGQRVIFRADAYGSKDYIGTVDEISPVSNDSAIAFSISDKREVKQFDIKIRFDADAYPELKNGMSAKVWIYKK